MMVVRMVVAVVMVVVLWCCGCVIVIIEVTEGVRGIGTVVGRYGRLVLC